MGEISPGENESDVEIHVDKVAYVMDVIKAENSTAATKVHEWLAHGC